MHGTITKDTIKALQPGQMLIDDRIKGFVARCLPSGAVTFGLRYWSKGKRRWLALGVLDSAFTADRARTKAEQERVRIELAERDPLAEKQAKRQDARNTVDAVLDDFMKRYAKNLRSADEIKRMFDTYIRPKIGKKSVYSLTRKDITSLLDAIDDRKDTKAHKAQKTAAPVMADRTLAHLRKAFTWYAARDDRFNSPIIRGMSRTKPAERARKRTLTDEETRDLWKTLETFDEPKVFGTLVKVLLLTAQRRDEIADMRWERIEGDSLTTAADDHKTGDKAGDVVVPLTDAVLKLLGEPQSGKRRGYVISTTKGEVPFSGFSKAKRALDKAIAELRKKAGREDMPHWVLNDLRRTARSLMSRAGVDGDVAERVLNHVIPGVRGVYDRYDYLAERRDALEKLAQLIDRIVNPADNVRQLPRKVVQ